MCELHKLCGCAEPCFEPGENWGHYSNTMCEYLTEYEVEGKPNVGGCAKDKVEVDFYGGVDEWNKELNRRMREKGTDYYLHHGKGFIGNYMGYIGDPFSVWPIVYYFMKLFGYRATKSIKGTKKVDVMIQAAIENGSDPRSHHVKYIRENGTDKD